MFVQMIKWIDGKKDERRTKKKTKFRNKRSRKKIATWNCQRVIFWYIKVNMIRLHTNTKTPTVKLFSLFYGFSFWCCVVCSLFSLILIFSANYFGFYYLAEFNFFPPWNFSFITLPFITYALCILKYFFKPPWNKISSYFPSKIRNTMILWVVSTYAKYWT